jgi:lysophospholipase L1-like esterase
VTEIDDAFALTPLLCSLFQKHRWPYWGAIAYNQLRGPTGTTLLCQFLSAVEFMTRQVNRMKLRAALFAVALTGLLSPALLRGQETGSLPESKAPAASAQTAPAPAQTAPATTPATTASGHANDDYWRKHDHLMLTDFPWLAKFKEDDLKLGPPAAGEDRIVFMGDSITEGWHLDGSFPGKPYINRGISGQTTPQMVLRFHQDVIGLKPKAVIILAGINDIAENTGPMTLEQTEDNFAAMAEMATANHIEVVLCSVLPAFDFPWHPGMAPAAKVVALNEWIKAYAAEKGDVYVDFYSAMKDDRGGLPAALSKDGVHPLPAGYAIMAPLAEAAIENALKAETSH